MFATVLLLGCLLGAPFVHSHDDTETVGHDFVADECLVCLNSVADDADLDVVLALITDSFCSFSPVAHISPTKTLPGLINFFSLPEILRNCRCLIAHYLDSSMLNN